jgi:hypothetical protein
VELRELERTFKIDYLLISIRLMKNLEEELEKEFVTAINQLQSYDITNLISTSIALKDINLSLTNFKRFSFIMNLFNINTL